MAKSGTFSGANEFAIVYLKIQNLQKKISHYPINYIYIYYIFIPILLVVPPFYNQSLLQETLHVVPIFYPDKRHES